MTVSPVSSATSNSSAHSSSSANSVPTLGYNDFLTLLTTELKNQDPTQPMDPTQMVTQLATISQVGQSAQMNSTLSSMLTMNSLSQAEQLIGHTITSADGTVTGKVASVSLTGSGSIATLTNGKTVSLGDGVTVSAQ
jgi:flagellar basal-body rod modification protein FlgD